jgi:hypothetical protein
VAFLIRFSKQRQQLLVFADRTDRAGINRALNGRFIGHRTSGSLSFAIISELEDGGNGRNAKTASDAKILIDFNFLSHDISSNLATHGL